MLLFYFTGEKNTLPGIVLSTFVDKNLSKNREQMANNYNQNLSQQKCFTIDDLVLIKNHVFPSNVTRKFVPKYVGPYKIVKKLGPVK